jgi:hypothetical protein
MRMLDGFNEGWIDFEARPEGTRKGTVTLDSAIRSMIADGQSWEDCRRTGAESSSRRLNKELSAEMRRQTAD